MKEITSKLNQLLASLQVYYQNLRGFHWNIEGRDFFQLHEKFEELYDEAAETIDGIAERIKILNGTPFHTFSDYLEHSSVKPAANVSNGDEAVRLTLSASETILSQLNQTMEAAQKGSDEGTASMISGLIESMEKQIWMLKAYLK